MKRTLVIDRKNTELDIENQRLVIRIKDQRTQSIPLHLLDNIVIASPIQLQSQLLNRLISHNLAISFLPSHHQHQIVNITPQQHGNHARKMRQYQMASQPSQALNLAKTILRTKLFGQLRNTQRWQRNYPHARSALASAHKAIIATIAKAKYAKNIPTLMGYEGQAARAYFSGVSAMLAPSYGFSGRNKRPPKDPINTALSYSYSLAQHAIEALISANGLEPAFGFLHQISYGRDSLACDLLELIRPAIDAWIIQLFAQQVLTPAHFYHKGGACYLSKTGREHFYQHWAAKRRALMRHTQALLTRSIHFYEK